MSPLLLCVVLAWGQNGPVPPQPPVAAGAAADQGPRELAFAHLVQQAYGNDAFVDAVLKDKRLVVVGVISAIRRQADMSYQVVMSAPITWSPERGQASAVFVFTAAQRGELADLPTEPDQLPVLLEGKCVACGAEEGGGFVIRFSDCRVLPVAERAPAPPAR